MIFDTGHEVKLIQVNPRQSHLRGSHTLSAHFASAKTVEQQNMDHLQARRERLVGTCIQLANQARAFLADRRITPHKIGNTLRKPFPDLRALGRIQREFSGCTDEILRDTKSLL